MKYLILLMLLGCATPEKCHELSNDTERKKCYDNKVDTRFYHESGWRYKHDRW